MKNMPVILCLGAALLLAFACQAPVAMGDDDTSAADAKAAVFLQAVLTARATGDASGVEAILAADDVNGELRALVEGAAGPNAAFLSGGGGDPLPLPAFDSGFYRNGDVMVCKGSGTLVSDLMSDILVNGYGHSGIINTDLAAAGADNCILSADADYILGGDEALNYQSLLDWAENDIVTVLHPAADVAGMAGHLQAVAANRDGRTVYAFLGYLGTPYGSFQPIPRADNDYWYCSKVPWRVYEHAGVNVEDSGFYDEPYGSGQRWTPMRDSLLYKTYLFYITVTNPFKSSAWRKAKADAKVRAVLAELVSPDELRASPNLVRAFTVTAAGVSADPAFNDAAYTGWSIAY